MRARICPEIFCRSIASSTAIVEKVGPEHSLSAGGASVPRFRGAARPDAAASSEPTKTDITCLRHAKRPAHDIERCGRPLSEGCRVAFVLHDIEGLEHKQISEMLGVSEAPKSQVLRRARSCAMLK